MNKKLTESERVYLAIIELIRDQSLVAGQPLREATVAKTLQVSRTPVREALRRLASEGTVEYIPNRGATLAVYTAEDIADIWALRGLLEPYGARLAAGRRTHEHLEKLKELHTHMTEAVENNDLDRLTDLNNQFHAEITDASGSRVLREAIALVRKKVLVRRTFGDYTSAQLQRSQSHHQDLIDAIEASNGDWASAIMRAHIEAGQETKWTPHQQREEETTDAGSSL